MTLVLVLLIMRDSAEHLKVSGGVKIQTAVNSSGCENCNILYINQYCQDNRNTSASRLQLKVCRPGLGCYLSTQQDIHIVYYALCMCHLHKGDLDFLEGTWNKPIIVSFNGMEPVMVSLLK